MPPSPDDSPTLPLIEPDFDTTYTLEVAAELSGISSSAIVHYVEQGFVRAASPGTPEAYCFDEEALRTLRHIEHLRTTCEMNDAGLRLMLELFAEVESLRAALRERR